MASAPPTDHESTDRSIPGSRSGLGRTGILATLVALGLVALVFLIADASSDGLVVEMPGSGDRQAVGFGDIIVPVVLGGVAGTVLAWIAGRFVPRPRATFAAICVAGLVVYGIVPFAAAEEPATGVWLNVMHLAAALPIVGGHARRLSSTRLETDRRPGQA